MRNTVVILSMELLRELKVHAFPARVLILYPYLSCLLCPYLSCLLCDLSSWARHHHHRCSRVSGLWGWNFCVALLRLCCEPPGPPPCCAHLISSPSADGFRVCPDSGQVWSCLNGLRGSRDWPQETRVPFIWESRALWGLSPPRGTVPASGWTLGKVFFYTNSGFRASVFLNTASPLLKILSCTLPAGFCSSLCLQPTSLLQGEALCAIPAPAPPPRPCPCPCRPHRPVSFKPVAALLIFSAWSQPHFPGPDRLGSCPLVSFMFPVPGW